MRTFTDNTGRAWTIAVTVDSIKRVKALLAVDLMEAVEGKLLERLISDPILLCDVIYALCKPQADAAKVTDEDFGRSMAGDAIDLATAALLEDLVDFFPSRRRALLAKALQKLRALETMAQNAAADRLEGLDLQKALDEAMKELEPAPVLMPKGVGAPSGNSPASSASPPAP